MTSLLVTFTAATAFSLVLTPVAGRIGRAVGAMDLPCPEKIHTHPTPRSGGLAIMAAFYLSLLFSALLFPGASRWLILDQQILLLLGGHLLIFAVGFWDDLRRLPPWVKFLFQILAASLAFAAGVKMKLFGVDVTLTSEVLAYALTVFWFVLLINAVNLIDGLDGLASGVVLFVCLTVIALAMLGNRLDVAILFAALGGTVLGFLRYNFNPSSIFLGDGGSYSLGYALAAISLVGATKSQTLTAFIIPLIALGLPLFDTFLAPIRRFLRGRKLFLPDRDHVHHRLLANGWSTRRAVLACYMATAILGLVALVTVHLRNEQAAVVLVLLAVVCLLLVRKLGYFDHLVTGSLITWMRDLSDEAGFTRDRRSFLDIQAGIIRSGSLEAVWEQVNRAMDMLEIEEARMQGTMNGGFDFVRTPSCGEEGLCRRCLFKMELPLLSLDGGHHFGTLTLRKDLSKTPITHYTLRRVEHLRRSVVQALEKIAHNHGLPGLAVGSPQPLALLDDLLSRATEKPPARHTDRNT